MCSQEKTIVLDLKPEVRLRLSALASFSCVVHCILTPLLIIGFPIIGSFSHNMIVEGLTLVTSIGCGVYVILNGYCKHKKRHAVVLFIVGASLWIVHLIGDHLLFIHLDKFTLILGSAFVICSYYINHRLLKRCLHHSSLQ